MKLLLKRRYLGSEYTIGSLFIDGKYFSDTMEDQVRDYNKDGDLLDAGETKVFGETAIPYGTYKIALTMSPKFTRLLPLVLDVPHFTGIRFHRLRNAKQSHGCIGTGENKVKGEILYSTKYEMRLIEKMLAALIRGEDITIEIM